LESMSGEESFERVGASNVPMGGRAPFSAQFELGADDKHKWDGASDERIKLAVMTALHWDLAVPRDRVQVSVDHGQVTLTGLVARDYERSRAEVDALMVPGVAGVTNRIVFFEGN
jgi:osmotically-inducible protein OsmY